MTKRQKFPIKVMHKIISQKVNSYFELNLPSNPKVKLFTPISTNIYR